jgi:hypothetical protein
MQRADRDAVAATGYTHGDADPLADRHGSPQYDPSPHDVANAHGNRDRHTVAHGDPCAIPNANARPADRDAHSDAIPHAAP